MLNYSQYNLKYVTVCFVLYVALVDFHALRFYFCIIFYFANYFFISLLSEISYKYDPCQKPPMEL